MKNLRNITLLLLLCHIALGQTLIATKTTQPSVDSAQTSANIEYKEHNQPETLFTNQSSFGGYFGLSIGYTDLDGKAALQTGGRFMFIANHYLGIGFGGKGFVTTPEELAYTGTNPEITNLYSSTSGGYGGLYLEPVILSMKPVHVAFPILIGAGALAESRWNNTTWDDYNYIPGSTIVSSVFFVAEPGVDVEFNIAKWFRIGLGASYRFTSDVDGLTETASATQNGFNYNMTFKMGWF